MPSSAGNFLYSPFCGSYCCRSFFPSRLYLPLRPLLNRFHPYPHRRGVLLRHLQGSFQPALCSMPLPLMLRTLAQLLVYHLLELRHARPELSTFFLAST